MGDPGDGQRKERKPHDLDPTTGNLGVFPVYATEGHDENIKNHDAKNQYEHFAIPSALVFGLF